MKKLQNLFLPLEGEYLEVREGKGGYQGKKNILIYKDARVDMNVLDKVVGSSNWQRKHYEVKGNLYCSVGIYDEDKSDWVWKDDAGAPSNFESEKGESSDSFKRACTNWGIGRELYTEAYRGISISMAPSEKTFGWYVKNQIVDAKVIGVGIYDNNGNARFKKKYDEGLKKWVEVKL
jgi:hypothetical protein